MFHFKNSFFKLLKLFAICFSFTNAAGDNGYNEKVLNCRQQMMSFFGQETNSLPCIHTAIRTMKLYGENSFTYSEDITSYYRQFHSEINPDQINLPSEFCELTTNNFNFKYLSVIDRAHAVKSCELLKKKCREELEIFEQKMVYEELLLADNLGFTKRTSNFTPNNTDGASSSSSETLSETDLKSIILKNALYYHKEGGPPSQIKLTEETKKFFHDFESHGYLYLEHIAEFIILAHDQRTNGPKEFCIRKYKYLKYPNTK